MEGTSPARGGKRGGRAGGGLQSSVIFSCCLLLLYPRSYNHERDYRETSEVTPPLDKTGAWLTGAWLGRFGLFAGLVLLELLLVFFPSCVLPPPPPLVFAYLAGDAGLRGSHSRCPPQHLVHLLPP